jgi:glycosyltransferase involved in cell wall biosynthesis
VSIVTPAFNAAAYLPTLLDSVAAQDYPHIEHIVIDDGSADGGATMEVLQRYAHVKWWRRENRGQYPTLNEGFRSATGEFITTISADDFYCDPGAIRALAECLINNATAEVAYGWTKHVTSNLTPFAVQPYQRHPVWMLRYNLGFIFHCSLLLRRTRMVEDDLFLDESLRYIADAEWMAQMTMRRYRFRRVDRFIAAYRHHEQQTSTLASRNATADRRRSQEHELVAVRLRQNRIVRELVLGYDTMQQRRVKLIGAARHGGASGVGRLVRQWLTRRRRDG